MYGADGSVLHVVGPGEGWTGLSKAYGTSPHRLRELNPWMRQPRPGTAVLVHPGAQHAPAPPAAAAGGAATKGLAWTLGAFVLLRAIGRTVGGAGRAAGAGPAAAAAEGGPRNWRGDVSFEHSLAEMEAVIAGQQEQLEQALQELEARQKAYSTRVTAGLSKELELLGAMHRRMLQTHTNLRALKAEMGRLKVTAELQQSEREEWGKLSRDEIRAREEALQGAKGNVQKLSTQMQTLMEAAQTQIELEGEARRLAEERAAALARSGSLESELDRLQEQRDRGFSGGLPGGEGSGK